jgi:hypothetical protein
LRVAAKVEDVGLRETHVFEQLPRRIRQPVRAGALRVSRQVSHDPVEVGVRIMPVEQPCQVVS